MTRQQQLCNNKWFRLAVSVILTFAVLLVFVFSPFAEAHAVGVLGTELIDIIIAGLSACGITFTTTGGFGSLEDYVSYLIDEYAVDQNTTALGLLNGAQYGNNKLGQLLLNNRLVRFISAFATYIKAKFSLVNNENKQLVEAGTSIGDYVCYAFPFEVSYNTGVSLRFESSANHDAYVLIYANSTSTPSVNFMAIGNEPFTVQTTRYRTGYDPVVQNYTSTVYENLNYISNICVPYPQLSQYNATDNQPTVNVIPNTSSVTQARNRILDAIADEEVQDSGVGIGVSTNVINPPLDDSDYDDGDGALVDVGSTWGATLKDILDKIRLNWQNVQAGNQDISMDYAPEKEVGEQLPEQTDIENLPGGTAWNPTDQQLKFFEFESIWHYVAQWISDFSAGAGVVWNAAVELPSPVVNMVYAMVTLAIIFGVIKVMRA